MFLRIYLGDEMPDSATPGYETVRGKGPEPLTREQLYELVWNEPMLRIGERLGVSSSYMARVCTDLRVPRPPRGYWAQCEFGKTQPQRPALPPSRPGDVTVWRPGHALGSSRPAAVHQTSELHSGRTLSKPLVEQHELLLGVAPHFLKSRKSEAGLLRPFKRLLVDIVTSKRQLDVVLGAANELFLALEAKGHRVTLAPPGARMRRAEFDESETPNEIHYPHGTWAPDRVTVVYIGDVPIGLTIFETTAEVEVMYVKGTYIPVSGLSPSQLRQYQGPTHWKTKQSQVSGRFCLQAYCPHHLVAWTMQWRSASAKGIPSFGPELLRELEKAAPMLTSKVAEAETRAQAQRTEWEEERQRQREEQELARQARMRQEARTDLLAAIEAWDRTRRIQDWIALVEREAKALPEADRQQVVQQLERAKGLVGSADALALLREWKAPGERRQL